MHTAIAELEQAQLRADVPDFRPGDTLKVHVKVTEGNRSRIQVFQGVVIRRQGGGLRVCEAEVGSGRAVVISIEPDETLSRAVHRLDHGQVDLATGALRIDEAIGSYLDREAFTAALREARPEPPEPLTP